MAVFTWLVDYGATKDIEPRIRSAQFGDGYEQRYQDGLNAIREVWQVQFSNRDTTEADAIEAFLEARGAVENFDWTPPRQSTAKKFICKAWSRSVPIGNVDTITATFTQVYEE